MYQDIIQNPIFIGVFVGAMTYLYMLWNVNKKKNKNKSKKDINILVPITAAIVSSIIAYSYNNYSTTAEIKKMEKEAIISDMVNRTAPINTQYQFTREISSESPTSFHLISRGVNIPNNLNIPDVFIETY
jgi:hypothetical protein